MIHRRDTFRAADYLVKRATEKPNIEFVLNATVDEILGENFVSSINVIIEGNEKNIACDGVFGAIGEQPNLKFDIEGLNRSSNGQIITDSYCKTNIDNLYAVGDIREREVYQIITAVADGALVIEGILKN